VTATASGQTLTWIGSFTVLGGGNVSIRFKVQVSQVAGDYTNTAGGTAAAPYQVAPATNAALVSVGVGRPPSCPGKQWFLAEGSTREGFDEYVLVFNTATDVASVNVVYTVSGGPNIAKAYTVAAQQRLTIPVFDPANVGRGKDVGAIISSDKAIVVERAMYVRGTVAGLAISGAHVAVAQGNPFLSWYFAEGTTIADFQTYFTVVNPTTTDTAASITYGLEGGGTKTATKGVPALSRVTGRGRLLHSDHGLRSHLGGAAFVLQPPLPVCFGQCGRQGRN
jgi:hypothetical protein